MFKRNESIPIKDLLSEEELKIKEEVTLLAHKSLYKKINNYFVFLFLIQNTNLKLKNE
jgi:hypothetical protein